MRQKTKTHCYLLFFMQVINFLPTSAAGSENLTELQMFPDFDSCNKSGGALVFGKCICYPNHIGKNCDVLLHDKIYANSIPVKNLNSKIDQKVTFIHFQYRRNANDVSEDSGSDKTTSFSSHNLLSTSTTTYSQLTTFFGESTSSFIVESSKDKQFQISSALAATKNNNKTDSNDLFSKQTLSTLNATQNLGPANQSNSSIIDPILVPTTISAEDESLSNVAIKTIITESTKSSTKSTSAETTSLSNTESIEFHEKDMVTEELFTFALNTDKTNASLGSSSSATKAVSFPSERAPSSPMQLYTPNTVKIKPTSIFKATTVTLRSTNAAPTKTPISMQPSTETTTPRFTQVLQQISFTKTTSPLLTPHRTISTSLNQTIRQQTNLFTKIEETTPKTTTIPRLVAPMHCPDGQILLSNTSGCAYYWTYYVQFKLNRSFHIDYYNLHLKRSRKFIVDLKSKIKQAISGSIYSGIRILSLKKGSLMVESEMYFRNFSNYNISSVNHLLQIALKRQFPSFYSSIQVFDKNECEYPNICGINATCINLEGSFSCQCKDGFTSTKATQLSNRHAPKKTCFHVCDKYICLNGGVCDVALKNKPFCRCPAGYLGPACQSNPWKMITFSLSGMLGAVCIISLVACLCSIRKKNRKHSDVSQLPVVTGFKRISVNEMKNSSNPFGYPYDVKRTTSFLTKKTRHDSIKQERTTATFRPFAEEDHKL